MSNQVFGSLPGNDLSIRLNSAVPPVEIPSGHVGPVVLPGSGRLIWWTGRVAIGLRHECERRQEMPSQSALWVQKLMLAVGRPLHA
jgi:hypothetical protein